MLAQLCALLFSCSLSGHPLVYDGDTLYFGKQSVRLWGIDAEELDTINGKTARHGLVRFINSQQVTCTPTGRTSHHRIIAKCSTPDIPDLAQRMIERGYALDCARYSGSYYRSYEAPDARARLSQAPYC